MFPSFELKLILDHIDGKTEALTPAQALEALQEVASDALQAEEEHLVETVNLLLEQAQERLDNLLKERYEALDTFIEGLSLDQGEQSTPRNPRQIADDLNGVLRLPVRLTPEQQRGLTESPKQVTGELRDQVESALVTQSVNRLIGSVERRLEDELNLGGGELPVGDWDAIASIILDALRNSFDRRRERYLGPDGAITKDIQAALERINVPIDRRILLGLLLMIPQGSKAAFDKRTHRRVFQRTTRLTYVYSSARYLEERDSQEIADEVLAHLEDAQIAMQRAWGIYEWERMAALRPAEMNETIRRGLQLALDERYNGEVPLTSLSLEDRKTALMDLGRQALTEVYRQLLLSVITELWVDYLTQMEALRVSIGLEAYAQRDPLVQYKTRASAMYHELVDNMRLGVISRMFTYRPRSASQAGASAPRGTVTLPEGETTDQPEAAQGELEQAETGTSIEVEETGEADNTPPALAEREPGEQPGKSKRRRRRH